MHPVALLVSGCLHHRPVLSRSSKEKERSCAGCTCLRTRCLRHPRMHRKEALLEKRRCRAALPPFPATCYRDDHFPFLPLMAVQHLVHESSSGARASRCSFLSSSCLLLQLPAAALPTPAIGAIACGSSCGAGLYGSSSLIFFVSRFLHTRRRFLYLPPSRRRWYSSRAQMMICGGDAMRNFYRRSLPQQQRFLQPAKPGGGAS